MRRFVTTVAFALAMIGTTVVASAADEKQAPAQAPTQKAAPVQAPTQKGPVQKGEAAQKAAQCPVQKGDCNSCGRGGRRSRCR